MTDAKVRNGTVGTTRPSNGAPQERPVVSDRPQPMALQGLVNRIVRGLLRTPLLSRVVGQRLVPGYLVGGRGGRGSSFRGPSPRHDGSMLVGTPFAWGRNLRTGEPVTIRLQGKRRSAGVEVITDEDGV